MDYLTPTHQQILDVLNQSSVIVYVNNHRICDKKQYDGYTMTHKDASNPTGRIQFILCENVVQRNYHDWTSEMNRTLAHEAVHVAQICKNGKGYLSPLGFRKDIEDEAFAIQNQPGEVLRVLKKYCL